MADANPLDDIVARMRKQLAAETDPDKRANLQAALNALVPEQTTTPSQHVILDGETTVDSLHIGPQINLTIERVMSEQAQDAKLAMDRYLAMVIGDCTGLRLDAIRASDRQKPLELKDVYVPLLTTFEIPQKFDSVQAYFQRHRSPVDENEDDAGLRISDKTLRSDIGHKTRLVSVLEALAAHRRLTLLGKPGSGKSTIAAYVLLTLGQAVCGVPKALEPFGRAWISGALLPVRVVLRRFAESLPPDCQRGRARDLWHYLKDELAAAGLPDATADYIRRIALDEQGGAFFVLDGLDECGDADRRDRVLEAVDEFCANLPQSCRFLITARPYAWPDGPDPVNGVYRLADLDEDQIGEFIDNWYSALHKRGWIPHQSDADAKAGELKAQIGRADLETILPNPLLLTLTASVHYSEGRLPDDRAMLYDQVVDLMLRRWNERIDLDRALLDALAIPGLTLASIREVIEQLAFEAHADNVGKEGTADLDIDNLREAFRPILSGNRDKAELVIRYIEERAGLLQGQGFRKRTRLFTFPHRTFQEFLAACYLQRQNNFAELAQRCADASISHWQLVLALAARLAKAERGALVAHAFVRHDRFAIVSSENELGERDWRRAILAAELLLEIGVPSLKSGTLPRKSLAHVTDWLACLLEHNALPARDRVYAGELLARLGDPRFDPDHWSLPRDPNFGFVEIPAGAYTIGTRRADFDALMDIVSADEDDRKFRQNEINDTPIHVPRFFLARFPVTVRQWKVYVQAVSDDNNLGVSREMDYALYPDSLEGHDTMPVCNVSWIDALGYCRWLQAKLSKLDWPLRDLLQRGWRVTLPSELEWERAARYVADPRAGPWRDDDGRAWPWGNEPDTDRANYAATEIGSRSVVGAFSLGAKSNGLHDMIGNVYEWTRSKREPFPYVADDGREALDGNDVRVVRGGSFSDGPRSARVAFRGWVNPVNRDYNIGFRVSLSPPPHQGPSDL